MDVYSALDGQGFVWDDEKARSNHVRHKVRFEQAREVFLDPFARYEDASPVHDTRPACLGRTVRHHLLYVVHVVWDGDLIRIISARPAEPSERTRYEND